MQTSSIFWPGIWENGGGACLRLRRQVNLAKDLFRWQGDCWPDTLNRQQILLGYTGKGGRTLGVCSQTSWPEVIQNTGFKKISYFWP